MFLLRLRQARRTLRESEARYRALVRILLETFPVSSKEHRKRPAVFQETGFLGGSVQYRKIGTPAKSSTDNARALPSRKFIGGIERADRPSECLFSRGGPVSTRRDRYLGGRANRGPVGPLFYCPHVAWRPTCPGTLGAGLAHSAGEGSPSAWVSDVRLRYGLELLVSQY